MEKILSFDVGIIHLAYCLLTKKEYIDISNNKSYKWEILDWANIDLTDRDELKCVVCKKNASILHESKYYCKVHSRTLVSKPLPYEDFYTKINNKILQSNSCSFENNNSCTKICTMKNISTNNTYCTVHARLLYRNITNNMKTTILKKQNIANLNFDDTRLRLIKELESRKHLLDADVVVIENQPSFKNPRMKSISGLLYDYYLIRGIVDKEITKSKINKVKFMSPSNKIKLASEGENMQLIKLKATDESKAYKLTKSLGIKYTLEMVKHLPEWLLKFNSHKKKDDLADSFLQGAYYFEMNSMPLISNVFNSKKKTNVT